MACPRTLVLLDAARHGRRITYDHVVVERRDGVNLATGGDRADMAHLDGGAIMLDSRQGDLRLGKGSLIDASAGGAIREDGSFVSAKPSGHHHRPERFRRW